MNTKSALAFASACALKEAGDFSGAQHLFELISSDAGDPLANRAKAHLAHLDYYRGSFEDGRRRTDGLTNADGLARAEAFLYRSVNEIALNRSRDALRSAVHARNLAAHVRDPISRKEIGFRIARQLVHVYIARGAYVEAREEACTAALIARDSGNSEMRAVAAYLLGVAYASTGNETAFSHLSLASEILGDRQSGLRRWLLHVRASHERDFGRVAEARKHQRASAVSVPWEDALFLLAEGSDCTGPSPVDAPADELPFRLAACGVVNLVQGQAGLSVRPLAMAVEEFGRRELVHDRRGAALALAVALLAVGDGRRATELLSDELPGLELHSIQRWPWWHDSIARQLIRFALNARLRPDYWRALAVTLPHADVPLGRALATVGLTAAEQLVVTSWIANGDLDRKRLAARLDISEATLRNHLNRIREKLACDSGRGIRSISRAISLLIESSGAPLDVSDGAAAPVASTSLGGALRRTSVDRSSLPQTATRPIRLR